MFISDVLRVKRSSHVETIHLEANVELAVHKLAEHRIGALVVQDSWMKPVGIFSERDFINAIARDGAAVLGFEVQQLMSKHIISCSSSDRCGCHACDNDDMADSTSAGYRRQAS